MKAERDHGKTTRNPCVRHPCVLAPIYIPPFFSNVSLAQRTDQIDDLDGIYKSAVASIVELVNDRRCALIAAPNYSVE